MRINLNMSRRDNNYYNMHPQALTDTKRIGSNNMKQLKYLCDNKLLCKKKW